MNMFYTRQDCTDINAKHYITIQNHSLNPIKKKPRRETGVKLNDAKRKQVSEGAQKTQLRRCQAALQHSNSPPIKWELQVLWN